MKILKNPRTWLSLQGVFACLLVLDSFREPNDQATARIYLGAVRVYQREGRPLLRGKVQCRYTPSCSEYSTEAVQRYGIRRGLVLSVKRIASCQEDVAFGTEDPVP
jgi:putative component of membrane protein insertase Oxa1/YidC/SpoIIIJ protein YidD